MRTVPRLLAIALVLPLALAACSSTPEGTIVEVETEGGFSVYHVTKERHGQTIHVVKGQTIAVVLPNKVGSARRWTPEGIDPNVLVRASGTQTIGPRTRGGMVGGAAGHEKIQFLAVGDGTTPLTLALQKHPRDGGGRVVFRVNVVVSGGAAPAR